MANTVMRVAGAILMLVATVAEAGTIRSKSGATANVADRAHSAFQCLIDKLDAQGYAIKFMGGYRRHGSVRGSLHPAGLALDINQYSRNVTRPRMPGNEIELANSCGLVSGAQWHHADSGHFQQGGYAGRSSGHRTRLAFRRSRRSPRQEVQTTALFQTTVASP